MMPILVLLLCGAAGGLLFEFFRLPGGAMTGAMLAVILLNMLSSLPPVELPRPFQLVVYICLGIIVGNMYKPGMLLAIRDTWPVLLISTALVLLTGLATAVLVFKYGKLDAASAYLATSPGGLNVVVGLAADMGPNAPVVLAYQLVRLYAIVFTVPFAARLLSRLLQ